MLFKHNETLKILLRIIDITLLGVSIASILEKIHSAITERRYNNQHISHFQELASATGNILENKQLLDSLTKTKESSNTITESLATSQQLQLNLDKVTSFTSNRACHYRPLSLNQSQQ